MRANLGHSAAATFVSVVVALVFCIGAAWLLINRSYVVDQLAVWQYQPSDKIAALARDASMNSTGTFYFYAGQPVLHDSQDEFNASCPRQEKASAILGCYAAGVIHVYDVRDERLEAVPAVTAAHEMLHAAWDRMSVQEREDVGVLLNREYENLQASSTSDLATRMEYYERTAPDHLDNELHSIIATETRSISPELEQHFAQYFSDRSQVVDLYESYNDRFVQLGQATDSLKQELERLSNDISTMTDQYNNNIDRLNDDIVSFNARASGAYYTDEASFARDRDSLIARADELEGMRAMIDEKMAEYEQKRLVYNNQVDESNSLMQSLDSTLAPAPAL